MAENESRGLDALRRQACRLNLELPRNGLVAWTAGNVSVRDPASGYVAIKPSGVRYEELRSEDIVLLDLNGRVVAGSLVPSSDAASHLFIYRCRPDVGGIVHTHSTFATAFAALGRPIPVCLTAHADEFGGEIPCAGFAFIGDEAIGRLVVERIGGSRAVLLQNHGVFAIGENGEAAVKAAVMVEDIARTMWTAMQLGRPRPIPAGAIARLHRRYLQKYGQANLHSDGNTPREEIAP